MPTDFFTLRHRDRQRAAAYLQARSKVITAMDVIYKRVEIYNSAQINPASYKSLDIGCRLLELDDDGKPLQPPNSDPSDPIFFEREFYPEGDDRVPPSLREMSKWVKSGTIVPSVFADRFYSAIWGSIRWFPVSAFVPKKLLYPTGKPHTLLVILIKEEPSEELFRAEVMILTAAMITRLEGEECLEYNTIPVMAITIFGRMQARVLEAHSSQQGLVVKKTRLLDFSTNQVANKNMNILLGFMASDLVRDPRGPTAPTDIPTPFFYSNVDRGSSANRMPEVPRNQISQDSPSGPTPALVAAGTRLDEFGSLHEDTYYIKQGRTIDVTGGVCNGVLPVCKWATGYDINGNSVDNKNIRTEEFMIIGVQDRFNESGDSGSFVVDSTGAVVGLLFANYEHNLQAVGLALPVSDLMDTMNDRLKGPVSLRLP
ncbi:hypothetical protein N7453_005777 [Penicillium expansum]|nr:hypothetical protein N7453_005777 [Penicillium expansum]